MIYTVQSNTRGPKAQAAALSVHLPLAQEGKSRWIWPLQGLTLAGAALLVYPLLRFFL